MKLSDYLSAEKLTHAEFGKRIGVTQAAVNRYARGLRIPQREVMAQIVRATGGAVQPNDFFEAA